jgi:alkanesulfonate monooxygenase SsuD/methylene tetrahydromethanopterin reductase-like flavin-dependent oxidoreductase (luciferase family)
MAAATTRLRFCTLVYILPLHHPLEVAKSLATLATFSGDRVMLGAGAGWMREEFETLGVDFEGLVEHHGEFFDFAPLAQNPAPGRPIPIGIGGASKAALRRAARLGDGWLGAGNTPDEAEEILRTLDRLRAEAGRAEEPFESIVPLTVAPEADTLKRLSELGAHGTVNYPFRYSVGPDATLQQKLDTMRQYGEHVIAPMKDF